MKTKMFASLEEVIKIWLDEIINTEEDERCRWYYDDIAKDMAQTASLVYESCIKGQIIADIQEGRN